MICHFKKKKKNSLIQVLCSLCDTGFVWGFAAVVTTTSVTVRERGSVSRAAESPRENVRGSATESDVERRGRRHTAPQDTDRLSRLANPLIILLAKRLLMYCLS